MVAITVILAAVIAAFVLDIGPGDPDPTAGVTVDDVGGDEVVVTLNSLDDGANGVAVVNEDGLDDLDETSDYDSDNDLRTTGESSEEVDTSDNVVIAYSGDSPEDADTIAIIDNLD